MKSFILATSLLWCAVPCRAQVAPYDTIRVAEGIVAFVPRFTASAYVSGNITLIAGSDAAVVVDAGHFPAQTRSIIAAIKSVSAKPVLGLIITHWHPDHWVGIGEFRRAFPGIAVITTGETRRMMSTAGARFLAQYQDPAFRRTMAGMAATGTYPNGAPVSKAERLVLDASIPVLDWALSGWRGVTLDLPEVTFDSAAVHWHLGNREVEVRFPGRGNTAGDAVVLVPDANVVVAGDLVVAPTPYAYGAFVSGWLARLRELIEMRPGAIVPGHGAVMRDGSYLSRLIAVTEELRRQVGQARAAGLSLADARKRIDIAALTHGFTGGDTEREAAFEMHFLVPIVERLYTEATRP